VIVELILALYCLFGVVSSIYFLEIAAVPFQLMFFLGFGFVGVMSLKHAWLGRQVHPL
jgi:predicted membrane channel-forming protein YqfA (hemolysin III family)